jgi:hypothetical protein
MKLIKIISEIKQIPHRINAQYEKGDEYKNIFKVEFLIPDLTGMDNYHNVKGFWGVFWKHENRVSIGFDDDKKDEQKQFEEWLKSKNIPFSYFGSKQIQIEKQYFRFVNKPLDEIKNIQHRFVIKKAGNSWYAHIGGYVVPCEEYKDKIWLYSQHEIMSERLKEFGVPFKLDGHFTIIPKQFFTFQDVDHISEIKQIKPIQIKEYIGLKGYYYIPGAPTDTYGDVKTGHIFNDKGYFAISISSKYEQWREWITNNGLSNIATFIDSYIKIPLKFIQIIS